MSTMDRDELEPSDFDRLLGEIEGMDDEALDAVVAQVAADYNAPRAEMRPPTEAMWTRIAAAQQPARRGLHVQRWQLLAASVAFLAFGITIGRQWNGAVGEHVRAGAPVARVTHAASTPSAVATTAGSPTEPSGASASGTVVVADHPTHRAASSAPTRTHAAPRVDDGATKRSAPTSSRSDAAYQLATMRHFAAAEALLASYDGSARDAKTDAQLASWASDLLSQTRLLLDSPAGRDPVRRRLLQDLELVLVQMAQLSPDAPKNAALEHELIDGSVRHNDIITRLRTAVPAGGTTAL